MEGYTCEEGIPSDKANLLLEFNDSRAYLKLLDFDSMDCQLNFCIYAGC